MGKIPKEEIERIKQEVDLVEEVRKRGIELKVRGNGKEHVGLCPFHDDEKTPSFSVNSHKGEWRCFGCNLGGDAIRFIELYDKKDFRSAVESLSESPQKQQPVKAAKKENTINLTDSSSQKEALNVLEHYNKTLLNTPSALAYLEKRGLNNPSMIERFQIGFCDQSLHKVLPPHEKNQPEPTRELLKQWGFLKSNGREHFHGYLVFPVIQTNGKIGEVYGRRIKDREGTIPHLYLPGKHQGIFNHNGILPQKPLILCESIIDALTFYAHGFYQVTSSFGCGGFTHEMLEHIKSKNVPLVKIAYDNDQSGNEASDSLAQRLMNEGFAVDRLLLPKEQDINYFALSQSDPKKALADLIHHSQSYQKPQRTVTKPIPPKQSALQWDGTQAHIAYSNRFYRLRGLEKNRSADQLKTQLRVQCDDFFFMDSLDLASSRQRQQFISLAAKEIQVDSEVIKKDVLKLMVEVEILAERLLAPKEEKKQEIPAMSQEDEKVAFEFLKSPDLMNQILKDFETIGLIGEENNKLVSYLAVVSRKLDDPLAVLIQSSSSAGKTSLMDGVLSLVPPEDRQKWTSMTAQALYYMDGERLKHKVVAIAEEEGAEKATYPLKILQSEKELRIATTIKSPTSGEFEVQEKVVEGPTALLLTTTAAEVDEELINRFILLTVNEDREQTASIHQQQRLAKTLEGLTNKVKAEGIRQKHHNAQRLLKSVQILNPYADQLTFMTEYLRSRRDHKKYLGLIDSVAFLHQYQRPQKVIEVDGKEVEYLEVTLKDIEIANQLIHEVLGRCLDELAPQTRRLLNLILKMVEEIADKRSLEMDEIHFTRRQIREYTHWSDNQLKIHLGRLQDLEYLLILQGGRGQQLVYELLWKGEGQDDSPFVLGLIDPKTLKDPNFRN